MIFLIHSFLVEFLSGDDNVYIATPCKAHKVSEWFYLMADRDMAIYVGY